MGPVCVSKGGEEMHPGGICPCPLIAGESLA